MRSISRRPVRAVILAAAAALSILPAAAQAGDPVPPTPTMDIQIATRCVTGRDAPSGSTVTITQRKGTTVLSTQIVDGGATWEACFPRAVRSGQRITAIVTDAGNTIVQTLNQRIPVLTISVDPALNTISAHASDANGPLEGTFAMLALEYWVAGMPTYGYGSLGGDLDAEGNVTSTFDGARWYGNRPFVTLTFPNATVTRSIALPSVVVRAGSGAVSGTGLPGSTATVEVRRPTNALRGSVTAPVGFKDGLWRFGGKLTKNGLTAVAKVGDKVTSSALTGSGTVLKNTLDLVAGQDTGVISITCAPDSMWLATRNGEHLYHAETSTGVVDYSGVTIASGDRIEVGCMSRSGFGQRFVRVVP